MDMVTLPTLLTGANLTIMTDEVNSTEIVTVMSFASEATIVTPAASACNVSQLLPPLLVSVFWFLFMLREHFRARHQAPGFAVCMWKF